ncbi:MAG: 5-formyltetrahydrofolate cyclo-ligase [Gammaproteobacteria bacterium]|nr:5-formyltetrahydrofolate cyclo-ligase [Gammaproteobacteria bacterium]
MRQSAIDARRSLSDGYRNRASSRICKRVIHSHEFVSCKSVACYLPSYDEVDTTTIIERAWRAKKRVFAPVIDSGAKMIFRQLAPDTVLTRNFFGLWEPVSGPVIAANRCDLVITPVVVFDDDGNRIGMGSGYFDRCFQFLKRRRRWRRPKLVGLAFDCQRVEKIAPNPWDIPVYQVITESG